VPEDECAGDAGDAGDAGAGADGVKLGLRSSFAGRAPPSSAALSGDGEALAVFAPSANQAPFPEVIV
jgi:hypothetical protein